MAEKGNFTAYQQFRPLQGDISQDIQQQEENGARRRAQASVEAERILDRKDKAAKEKKDFWEKNVKPLSNYDTGSKSLNEAQARVLMDAEKQYVPIMETLRTADPYSEEYLKATLKLQKINNMPETMLKMTKGWSDRLATYNKLVAEDKIVRDPVFEKNAKAGFEGKLMGFDENADLFVAYRDKDGNGEDDYETYDQIGNMFASYNIQEKFNWDKDLEEASKNVKPVKKVINDGVTKYTTLAADEGYLDEYVSGQLYLGDKTTPSPRFKQYIEKFGIDPTNDKAVKNLENRYKNSIRLKVKGEDSQEQVSSALAWQKEANDQRDKASKQKGEENTADFSDFTKTSIAYNVIKDKDGKETKKVKTGDVYQGKVNIVRTAGSAEERLSGFTIDNNGNLIVNVDVSEKIKNDANTTPTIKEKKYSSKDKNRIVAWYVQRIKNPDTGENFKTVQEFKDKLKQSKNGEKGENKKPKIDY